MPRHAMRPRAGTAADARRRILEMVARHAITPAEAAELIRALQPPAYRYRSPVLRARVTDLRTGQIKTDVTIPAPALGGGRGLARRLRVPGPDIAQRVAAALRAGQHGLVASCANDHGERVELFLQ